MNSKLLHCCGSLLTGVMTLVLTTPFDSSAWAKDIWIAAAGSGCKAWSDEPLKPGESLQWNGGCADGRLDGKGVANIVARGKPVLSFEGTMREGKAQGPGELEMTDKQGTTRYTGGFADSRLDGYGVLQLADGGVYEGGFKNDKPDGYGVYKGKAGTLYQGDIRNGVPDGSGYLALPNGERYQGEFKKGRRHGKGTLLFPTGGVYEGEFVDGKAHGSGVFKRPNGDVYRATWKHGKADGPAELTRADGTRETQTWKNDKRVQP